MSLPCRGQVVLPWQLGTDSRTQPGGLLSLLPLSCLESSLMAWVTLSLSPHILQPLTAASWRSRSSEAGFPAPHLMVLSPPHQPIPALCWQHWESPTCAAGGITKNFSQNKKAAQTIHISLQLPRRALLGLRAELASSWS